MQSVDEKTGKVRWSKRLSSSLRERQRGKVIVENAAQIQGESDDKIIIGAHEGGLFALPYTANAGDGLRRGDLSQRAWPPLAIERISFASISGATRMIGRAYPKI